MVKYSRMFFPDLTHRVRQHELMDEPDIDPRLLARSLGFLRKVNKILGYTALVLALFNSVTSIIKGFTEIFDGPSMIGPGYWGVVLPAAIVALLRRPAAKEFFVARGGTSW